MTVSKVAAILCSSSCSSSVRAEHYSWSRRWNAVSLFAHLSSLLCSLKHTLIQMAITPLNDIQTPYFLWPQKPHQASWFHPRNLIKANKTEEVLGQNFIFIWTYVTQGLFRWSHFKPWLGNGLNNLRTRLAAELRLKSQSQEEKVSQDEACGWRKVSLW